MEIRNAAIVSTNLGMAHTEHGILSFYIHLDFGGTRQGFGGWVLDTNNPERQDTDVPWDERYKLPVRLPILGASSLLLGIDEVFKCDWEKLPGKSCRAYGDNGKLDAIGHYLEDKWLYMGNEAQGYEFQVSTFDELKEAKT